MSIVSEPIQAGGQKYCQVTHTSYQYNNWTEPWFISKLSSVVYVYYFINIHVVMSSSYSYSYCLYFYCFFNTNSLNNCIIFYC